MKWTTAQKKVIDTKDKDILVSAAAGSGKTAVLVERIMQKIMDKEHPVNVDQMLICTFTKAAAAQMKEKIQKAIEKQIELEPDNEHLARQAGYVRSAQITTIDGFCSYIIRNYYDTIDLNPGFRIANEGELALIKEDVVKEVIEDWYSAADEKPEEEIYKNFLDASLSVNTKYTDTYLEEIVLKLNDMASSHPNPYNWIQTIIDTTEPKTIEEFDQSYLMECIVKILSVIMKQNIFDTTNAITICQQPDGPSAYINALEADIKLYESFLNTNSYKQLYEKFETMTYEKLSRISKNDAVDPDTKDMVTNIRKKNKARITQFVNTYFSLKPERMLKVNGFTNSILVAVARLALDFRQSFDKVKEDKSILDFADIEHLTLKILTEDGNPDKPSAVALTLSKFYEEIFVDEYQDSNDVQEAILTSIVGKDKGKPYMFMVGDVKQSIYGFRMAKPDLFLMKSKSFATDDTGENIRIDLNKNFRSRDKVLDVCNFIFKKCMIKDVGRIHYTDNEKLYLGADYPEYDNDFCEIMIYDTEETEDEEDMDKLELELRMIARKIRKIVDPNNPLLVTQTDDNDNKSLRPATYDDIVILFRSMTGWTELINDVFASENIPVMVNNTTGYFSALEIRVMLSLLRVINNPLQDIPLVSVMRSPIGGFSNDDLARIRVNHKGMFIYDAVRAFIDENSDDNSDDNSDNNSDDALLHKCISFVEQLNQYRGWADYMSIHELLLKLYDVTGYYDCVLAMSDGKRRRTNLDMLVSRAQVFETTSYCGLFNFVRFMDKLESYSVDMGQASNDQSEGCVKVMTIHKSKGLEFPIVFVAGTGRKFNKMDTKSKIVVHPMLGIGTDYVNYEHRVKIKTITKSVLSKMIDMDNIDEELRVFYVALTRAKEKLIITGSVDMEKSFKQNLLLSNKSMGEELPALGITSTLTYMDLVIKSLMQTKAMRKTMEELDKYSPFMEDMTVECPISIEVFTAEMIKADMVVKMLTDKLTADYIRTLDTSIEYNNEMRQQLERLDSITVYTPKQSHKSKMSVSEIKMEKMQEFEEQDNHKFEENMSHIEKFNKKQNSEETVNKAALRGTLYHKLFEILPLEEAIGYKDASYDELKSFISNVASTCPMLEGWEQVILLKDIKKFIKSELAERMSRAHINGELKCEQPFFMGVPANTIYPDSDNDESILIQGIIDAYFVEDGQAVLMDYKTDSIKGLTEIGAKEMLIGRYKSQLDLYGEAIEKGTGLKVKEKIIYSVPLGQSFDINCQI